MRALKKSYIEDAINECGGDNARLWKVIKRVWPNKSKGTNITNIMGNTDENIISDQLNEHFCTARPNLACNIPTTARFERKSNAPETSFNFSEVTLDEVAELMRLLQLGKACGVDGLTARLLKYCGDAICPVLAYIFNLSFSTNEFPAIWKCAKVTPLFKDGSTSDLCNYRPISVLPVISKVLEWLAHNRLYQYMMDHGSLLPSQSGFRKGHSTSTCLVEFMQNLYDNKSKGRAVGVLFLDLKKAFDTMDHTILVSKLSHLGLSNNVLYWVESYLLGRSQVTIVNNVLSACGNLECGVLQGSILGPLFFILYVTSLPDMLPDSNVFLYADDTAIAVSCKNVQHTVNCLNNELSRANDWLQQHE